MQLEYPEVSDIAQSVYDDFSEVRDDARRRYDLYHMKHDPYVPAEVAREGKLRYVSAYVEHSAQTIRSDLLMNPTEFTVLPLAREADGRMIKDNEKKSEQLERALAILWGRMNDGRYVDYEVIWHQLVSPYAVIMLQFHAKDLPDQPEGMADSVYNQLVDQYENDFLPWSVYVPDPLTCAWVERQGRPTIFIRKYKMLVSELEHLYNHAEYSMFPDQNLIFESGYFKWVSDDYERESSSAKNYFDEIEVTFMDDGKYQYQLVRNPGRDPKELETGELLSVVPNPIGHPLAYIVPGGTSPEREPERRYHPYLLPLMQTVNQINDLRSTRATAARNLAGPHTYIPIDPEIQLAYLERGEKIPDGIKFKKGTVPYTLGEIKEEPSELSDDWDKLQTDVNTELERYLPSPFINIVDPAVLKAATATSILHAAEAGLRLYGPLMTAKDVAIKNIMEDIVYSIKVGHVKEEIALFASGEEMARGKNLKAGSVEHLSQAEVQFAAKILVRTRSMSRAQASAQYEAALAQYMLPDGTRGPVTFDDLIDAANYTDKVQQKMKLAEEGILDMIKPWLMEMAAATVHQKILIDSGIDIPIGAGGAQQETPAALPNQAQQMEAPTITGPEGGTSPTGGL